MKKNILTGAAVLGVCAALTTFSAFVYHSRSLQRANAVNKNTEASEYADYQAYTVTSDAPVIIHTRPHDESDVAVQVYPGCVVGFIENAENGYAYIYEKDSNVMGYIKKEHLKQSEFAYSLSDISIVDTSSALYSYEEMKNDISQLSEKYEAFSSSVIGKSEDGRNIFKVSVGNAPKKILLSGGVSGTDYTTSQLLMKLAEYYSHYIGSGYFSGYKYSDLIQNVSLDIIPMLNPDGITINQLGPDTLVSDSLRRKVTDTFYTDKANASGDVKTTYYSSWCSNANGVDIRRNFPVGFDSAAFLKGSSRSDFRGDAPLSEAESRAVAELLESGGYCAVIILGTDGSGITYSENTSGDTAYGTAEAFAKTVSEFTGYPINSTDSIRGKGGSMLLYCSDKLIPAVEIGITISGSVPKAKDIPEPWTKLRELPAFLARQFL